MKNLFIAVIRGYQKWIAPGLAPRCKYFPSCSAYTVTALTTHGALRGSALAAYRILRCNPWSHGGVDHVPTRGIHERKALSWTH